VIEVIAQLNESPSKPMQLKGEGSKNIEDNDKLIEAHATIKLLKEKNQKLKEKNSTLSQELTSQISELKEDCYHLKKFIKNKLIQGKQLTNMYKRNLSLRSYNKKLSEDVYLAKNMCSNKNLEIFLK